MSARLVKLVRDRIDAFLASDVSIVYEPLPSFQRIDETRRKLIEEAIEYLMNPCLSELADVYEIVRALAEHDLGVGMGEVRTTANDKKQERGGFDVGMGMYAVLPGEHVETDRKRRGTA